jgi:hypothetical protein
MNQHYSTTGYLAFAAALAGTVYMISAALGQSLTETSAPSEQLYHPVFAALAVLVLTPFLLIALFFFSLRRILIVDTRSLAWQAMGLLISAEFMLRMLMWLLIAYLFYHPEDQSQTEMLRYLTGFTFDIGLILQLCTIFLAGLIMPAIFPRWLQRGTVGLVCLAVIFYLLSSIAVFSLLANLTGLLWVIVIGSYLLNRAAALPRNAGETP